MAMNPDEIPALEPPPGIVPDLENPPNNNASIHIFLAICVVVSTLALVFRAYNRAFIVRKFFLRDYILFIAYASLINPGTDIQLRTYLLTRKATGQVVWIAFLAVFYKIVVDVGIPVHQWDMSLTVLTHYLYASHHSAPMESINGEANSRSRPGARTEQYIFSAIMLFLAVMGLIKTAILLEWIHVFVPLGIHNALYWAIMAVMWSNIALYASLIIVSNISCTPHEYSWNKLIPGGSCERANTLTADTASAFINLAVDLFILAVPQRAIWKLNMPWPKRLGIAVLFAIGFLGIAAACLRVWMTLVLFRGDDQTYALAWEMTAGGVELLCGFLVICGPTIPRAVHDSFQLFWSLASRSSLTGNRHQAPSSDSRRPDGSPRSNTLKPATPKLPLNRRRDEFVSLDGDDELGYYDIENNASHKLQPLPETHIELRPLGSSNV